MATQHLGGPGDSDDLRDRSLGELLKQLSEQTTQLVHQELELAKAELTQKGKQAGAGAGLVGAAGALGLAALIVAVVYGAIAAFLALHGRDKVKQATPLVPAQTVETVKEDVESAKTQMRSEKT
jgi:hypothetical protein